jgi:hypothetical protein
MTVRECIPQVDGALLHVCVTEDGDEVCVDVSPPWHETWPGHVEAFAPLGSEADEDDLAEAIALVQEGEDHDY